MGSDNVLRDSDSATIDLKQEEAEHADTTANAKRVILTDTDGTAFSSSNPLNVDTEITLDGNVIIDNIAVFATDISDSSTTSFGIVDAAGHQFTVPGKIQGRTVSYEDTSFVTGDSPVVHDVNTSLSRNGVDGYIVCDGPGNITIDITNNGTNYGGQHTLKRRERMNLRNLDIDSIRVTWVSDSAYRVLVV